MRPDVDRSDLSSASGASPLLARIDSFWGRIALVLLSTLFFSLLLEGAARVAVHWWPLRPYDPGLGFDPDSRLFIPSPTTHGFRQTNPKKTDCFVPQTFRDPKRPGTFRIVAVGESSVNRLDSELHSLAERLTPLLASAAMADTVDVINAGGHAYGSHRLVLVLKEVLLYRPDVVLLYLGNNEFQEVVQLRLARTSTLGLQKLVARSVFLRFLQDRLTDLLVTRLRGDREARIMGGAPNVHRAWNHKFTHEDVEARMATFEKRLAQMILDCQMAGVPVILGTVPSNLVRPGLPTGAESAYREVEKLLADFQYERAVARGNEILASATWRRQSSRRENEIIRRLAEKHAIPLADVEKAIIEAEPHGVPGETLFSDYCHLNHKGNPILMRTFEVELLRTLGLD